MSSVPRATPKTFSASTMDLGAPRHSSIRTQVRVGAALEIPGALPSGSAQRPSSWSPEVWSSGPSPWRSAETPRVSGARHCDAAVLPVVPSRSAWRSTRTHSAYRPFAALRAGSTVCPLPLSSPVDNHPALRPQPGGRTLSRFTVHGSRFTLHRSLFTLHCSRFLHSLEPPRQPTPRWNGSVSPFPRPLATSRR
jgi:hypothetical protein